MIHLSSAKDEYRGLVNIVIQSIWFHNFPHELRILFHFPKVIWCDNQSTLNFCRVLVQYQWTKHIEIHMHYIYGYIMGLLTCSTIPLSSTLFTSSPRLFLRKKFTFYMTILGWWTQLPSSCLSFFALYFEGGFCSHVVFPLSSYLKLIYVS